MSKMFGPPLSLMIKSGLILKETFSFIKEICIPGVSCDFLNKSIYKFILDKGANPIFYGYNGFPGSACISINEQVVHGLPSNRVLCDGDIVKVDCGIELNGAITDACRTFLIGTPCKKLLDLVEKTQEALDMAIFTSICGNTIGDISYTIQKIAECSGYNVPRELTGHGVGFKLHQPPWIYCHGRAGTGDLIEEGMYLAIEPILIEGSWEIVLENDGWTVSTRDKSVSCHIEDTIYISSNGPIILTR